jgi:hypothetical protein
MRHPFWVEIRIPFSLIVGGSGRRICAGCLVASLEVAFDEVALFKGVFNWVTVVATWQLDYFVEADMVELSSLLLVDPIDHHDELVVMMPLLTKPGR